VSHDRHLLDACADRLWLVADGRVTPFDGDLEDYRRRVLSDRNDSEDGGRANRDREARPNRTESRRIAADRRAETKPLRQRVAKAEAEIERLTLEIEKLDAALAK